jgi:MYXO-CTERM domain-containing protein
MGAMPRLLLLAAGLLALAMNGAAGTTFNLVPLAQNPGGQSPETSAEQWLRWAFSFDRAVDGGDPLTGGLVGLGLVAFRRRRPHS